MTKTNLQKTIRFLVPKYGFTFVISNISAPLCRKVPHLFKFSVHSKLIKFMAALVYSKKQQLFPAESSQLSFAAKTCLDSANFLNYILVSISLQVLNPFEADQIHGSTCLQHKFSVRSQLIKFMAAPIYSKKQQLFPAESSQLSFAAKTCLDSANFLNYILVSISLQVLNPFEADQIHGSTCLQHKFSVRSQLIKFMAAPVYSKKQQLLPAESSQLSFAAKTCLDSVNFLNHILVSIFLQVLNPFEADQIHGSTCLQHKFSVPSQLIKFMAALVYSKKTTIISSRVFSIELCC